MDLLKDHIRVAGLLFLLDGVLGILGVAAGAMYGAAWSSGKPVTAFLTVLLLGSAAWIAFCYCAYLGLVRGNPILRAVFWLHVVGHVFAFPVGTAVSAASVWLWRELSKPPVAPAPD